MEMKKRSQSASESLQKKSLSISELKKQESTKKTLVSPVWKRNMSDMRQNSLLTMIRLWPVDAPPGCRVPGGWSIRGVRPRQVAVRVWSLNINWLVCTSTLHQILESSSFISSSWAVLTPPLLHVDCMCTATLGLFWLLESYTGSPGKRSDCVCSSIWLSSCCLPGQLPAEERFCWYQRRVTCLGSSCHQVSSQSGPREHLSPSLNWLQHLIKALLRDEGDKNDAPSLRGRRTLKENVSANDIFSPFGAEKAKTSCIFQSGPPTLRTIVAFCQHSSLWCTICPVSLSIHTPPTVSKHCQPDSTVTGG